MEEAGVPWAAVTSCDFFGLLDTGAEQGHKCPKISERASMPFVCGEGLKGWFRDKGGQTFWVTGLGFNPKA